MTVEIVQDFKEITEYLWKTEVDLEGGRIIDFVYAESYAEAVYTIPRDLVALSNFAPLVRRAAFGEWKNPRMTLGEIGGRN